MLLQFFAYCVFFFFFILINYLFIFCLHKCIISWKCISCSHGIYHLLDNFLKWLFWEEKYQTRLNAVRERVLWRLLWIHSASATDSSSMGLNRPSQSCQNVSSLVCTLSFTYASYTHSAGKVCVVWQNLAALESVSVSLGLRACRHRHQ